MNFQNVGLLPQHRRHRLESSLQWKIKTWY